LVIYSLYQNDTNRDETAHQLKQRVQVAKIFFYKNQNIFLRNLYGYFFLETKMNLLMTLNKLVPKCLSIIFSIRRGLKTITIQQTRFIQNPEITASPTKIIFSS
jgi:hypothetical protein